MTRKRFDTSPIFNVESEGLVIQQVAGSTAPLLEIKDHSGSSLMTVSDTGEMTTAAPSTIDTLTVDTSATLPTNTSIGNVSALEIGYLDGVTSALQTQLNAKAPLESPSLTGTPVAPTAIQGTNTTQIATTAFVRTEVANIIDAAPAALDTLNELAAALGDDPNFATTVSTALGTKAPLASPALTGTPTAPTATPRDNSTQISTTAFVQQELNYFLPAGLVSPFAGSTAPDGWLLCAGQNVSRTTYASLFAAIGTTYGAGDGSTTFTLPDLRGRVVAGIDNMTGTAASRLTATTITGGADAPGEVGGAQTHTLTEAQLPIHKHTITHNHAAYTTPGGEGGHTHTISDPGHIHGFMTKTNAGGFGTEFPARALYGSDGDWSVRSNTTGISINSTNSAHTHTVDLPELVGDSGNAGSGSAHNNVQPTMVMNYIIKA